MTDKQVIQAVNMKADWQMKIQAKRNSKLAQMAKRDPVAFIAHIGRVLSRYTKDGYLKYKKQITLIAEALPDDESWAEHQGKLKRSANGVFVYLRSSLEIKDYYLIAESVGLNEQYLDGLAWKRAEEIYPRRQKKKTKAYKDYSYTPPKIHNIPNDKIAHNIRSATLEELAYGALEVIEGEDKNGEEIKSYVELRLDKLKALGYNNLDRFDWFVCMTCLAIQAAGNDATTINAIFRAMTGKKGDAAPSEDMKKVIIESVAKGIAFVVASDARGICEFWKKPGKGAYSIGSILPARIDSEGIVKGAKVENLVVFTDTSPLVKIAEAKGGQFMTYDAALLDVPVNTNKQNILIAPYLLQHIEDTAFANHLKKVIVIDNAIAELNYKGHRSRFAKSVEKCFAHWKKVGYIKEYEVEQNGKGKINRITFSIPPRKKKPKD